MQVEGDADESKFVLIVYDQKVVGESCTRPHLRLPVFQAQHCNKLVQAVLKCRDQDSIKDGDLYCIPDAGKHGSFAPNDMIFSNGSCSVIMICVFVWLGIVHRFTPIAI